MGPVGPPPPRRSPEDNFDEWVDGFWRWLRRVLCFLAAAMAAVGALCFLLILLWRWFLHGLGLIRDRIFVQFSDLYRWIDEFSPSETEAERARKYSTLRSRLVSMVDTGMDLSWARYLTPADLSDSLLLVLVVIVAAVGVAFSCGHLARSGRRVVQRMRGVQFEAMRPGSQFSAANPPTCQVQILIPGLFSDAHQGYGVRLANFLVTPMHVIYGYDEVVLRGPTGIRIAIKPVITSSRMVDDLAYIRLDASVFASLGATIAKGSQRKGSFVSSFATCCGPLGQSTGRLSKSALRGRLNYDGSTLPGMSGAAYLIQGTFAGIHQAATGSFNMGIAAEIFRAEIPRLEQVRESVMGVSPPSPTDSEADPAERHRYRGWKAEELEQIAEDRYLDDSWTRDDVEDDFWTRKLSFADESVKKVSALKDVFVKNADGAFEKVSLSLQSPDGQAGALDLLPVVLVDYVQELKNANVLERLDSIEKALQEPARQTEENRPAKNQVKAPKSDFPCQHCAVSCSNAQALENHIKNSHAEKSRCADCDMVFRSDTRLRNHRLHVHSVVALESAIAEDTGSSGRIVRQAGSFLGRSPSQRMKSRNSVSSSKPSAGRKGSPSMEELLSAILESQQAMSRSLNALAKDSAGPSSDIMRN